jgi:rhodanese-related sulfurtransferase
LLFYTENPYMKSYSVIIILFLFQCSSITAQDTDSVKFKSLLPYDFHLQYLKAEKALLVDVREFYEFKGKRLKEAVNIPLSGNLEFSADTIDKDISLFLYCLIGDRSEYAAKYFCAHGFTKVYSLEGGIEVWRKEGMQVARKKLKNRGKRR